MTTTLGPRDAKELQQAVEWALNEGVTLDVRGGGSKLQLGKPMTCDQVLDLSGLSGIVDYAPEELVVTLRAGTPLREVEALLAQRNQMLAFEPPDLGPLRGREPGEGTLVGTIMGNFAVGGLPQGAVFDGTYIWVTNFLDSTVSKLKASDGSLIGTFPTGQFPEGTAFDGANVWIANAGSNNVSKR